MSMFCSVLLCSDTLRDPLLEGGLDLIKGSLSSISGRSRHISAQPSAHVRLHACTKRQSGHQHELQKRYGTISAESPCYAQGLREIREKGTTSARQTSLSLPLSRHPLSVKSEL